MKRSVLFAILFTVVVSIFSCKKESSGESLGKSKTVTEAQKPEELGKELFNGKGACIACHQVDQKVVGPSLQDIAKIYKGKNGDMVSFLKGEGEPIVDPTQYEIMKTNFAITKAMSDTELKALEAYVYSTLK
jgi:cytochrome c